MRLLLFSGSPTPGSTTSQLLRATAAQAPAGTAVAEYEAILTLPLFDPTLTATGRLAPPAVAALHQQLAAAQAVLFATPEYAYGLPGSFKNALDWLVATGSLYGKPTGALGASPSAGGGGRALASLLLTLEALGAAVPPAATLAVPLVRAQLADAAGPLTAALRGVVTALLSPAAS